MPSYGTASRAIIGRFYRRLQESPPLAWWDKIGFMVQSDQDAETYIQLGMPPAAKKWLNERQETELRSDKIIVYNDTYESSIRVPIEDLRRDKTGQHMARAGELAVRMGWQHWEKLLTNLISAGGATTYGNAYTGTTFFSTTHSLGSSGTIINDVAATEVPNLNVGTAAAPTSAEAALAILDTITYMQGWADDQGEPLNQGASSFVVMCPPNLAGAFNVAVYDATVYSASAVPAGNPLQGRGIKIDVAVNTRLASSTTLFWVFRTDADTKPFLCQEELAPQMQVLAEGSEYAMRTNLAMFGAKACRGVGYGDPFLAIRATLS